MKYPEEYAKKALDLIEANYVTEDGVESTAILTLAAFAIGLAAYGNQEDWGVDEETAFYMVREAITKPEPYEPKTTPQE